MCIEGGFDIIIFTYNFNKLTVNEGMIFLSSQAILAKILVIPAILIAFTVHEYAHALVVDRLGDKTPKFQGRLTLNPFAHIDLAGFLMIILIGFGWAKPVETNPSAFRRGYKDDIKVSVAGVTANLITAVVFAFITVLLYKSGFASAYYESSLSWIIGTIFSEVVSINCMLVIFNLMPIPGLDGFHILRDLFPKVFYRISGFMYQYQLIILIVFVVFLANYIVGIPYVMLYNAIMKLAFSIV
ncbi:MAG: putative metalloprotease [Clostridiaceae bacterium]|nr:putative metalloprotease [Clostridiaceae bacterium]